MGHRRRPGVDEKFIRSTTAGRALFVVAAALVGLTILVSTIGTASPVAVASPPATDTVSTTVSTDPSPPATESRPPITANDFLPEDRDLTSCIGVLERPGCGSESRGGWRQTAVLAAIFVGLAVVFGNVVRGVRRNRRQPQP